MSEIDFAYVGLGVHEEVVYSVADELGYYADEGVRVSIRDGVRWDDEQLRQAAVVGLVGLENPRPDETFAQRHAPILPHAAVRSER